MNKQKTTFNASDVYQVFARQLLASNPDYWGVYSRKKDVSNAAIYMKHSNQIDVVTIMDVDRWMKIVKMYYLLARKKVIEGHRLQLGHRLGAIQARTISRNFKNKKVDFNETKKQPLIVDPETGKTRRERVIYFTSDEYSRIKWEKINGITNEKMYKFSPCKGNSTGKGFAREFSAALKENPLLSRKFKQFTDELPID